MRWLVSAACILGVSCYQQTYQPYYSGGPPTESGQVPPPQPQPCVSTSDGQVGCAEGHAGYPQGYPPGYVGDGYPSGYTQGETCLSGSNGVVVCGYDCKVGTAGIANCASAPGGSCATASDGLVYCQVGR